MALTDDEIRDYAEQLILDHATDVEFISVIECYGEWAEGFNDELSDDDALKVHDLIIRNAKVTVTFDEPVES